MTQFIANCEVEAHLSLAEGNPLLTYSHPATTYKVFMRDLRVEPGSELPLLSVQIEFGAPTLSEANDVVTGHLKEFLDYLTLVTNCKFRLHRILQIFNWEPGSGMRECIYYTGSANQDVPIPALSADLLRTIALMQEQAVQPRLRRALKWFGNGVASTYRDDQFTFFWFVIEVLAQVVKEPTAVPDKCPVCRGPLFCPACGVSHLHRPYPKQAIQQLFAKYIGENWNAFYDRASEARNRLMHGEEVAAIEAALKIDLSDLVDDLGRLAWTAIINQFIPALIGKQIGLLQTNRYVHVNLSAGARMEVGFVPNFADPTPDHFPKVQVKLTSRRGPMAPPADRGEAPQS